MKKHLKAWLVKKFGKLESLADENPVYARLRASVKSEEPWYEPAVGLLNYYVLQWIGFRLALCYRVPEMTYVGVKFIRRKPGEGWILNPKPVYL